MGVEVVFGFAIGYWIGTRQGREGFQRALDSAQAIAASPETRKLVSEGLTALETVTAPVLDRLGGKSPEPQATVYQPGHRYPVATQSERDHIPIVPPSATRLLARIGPLSGERLGLELLVALLLGIPALISGAWPRGVGATRAAARGRSRARPWR